MRSGSVPRISFGIIVLNGEPFTRYCLRALYPYAYEIIVVEGGHEDTSTVCTPQGHSIDGTVETLRKFKEENDPEGKIQLVTREGFWPKTDELGRHRTAQSRAYAERATGDYLWQIDIDEFYRPQDMREVLHMLRDDPSITAVSFKQFTFWGSPAYEADSWALRRNRGGWHRIFKWAQGSTYLTHEPPTILDERGIDVQTQNWITGETMARRGVRMYHYSLLFPEQVRQKVQVYQHEKPEGCAEIADWAKSNYFKIGAPFRVHNLYNSPSWLQRFTRDTPPEILQMIADIKSGSLPVELRQTDDIEELLHHWWYPICIHWLKFLNPLAARWEWFWPRLKNMPGKVLSRTFHSQGELS